MTNAKAAAESITDLRNIVQREAKAARAAGPRTPEAADHQLLASLAAAKAEWLASQWGTHWESAEQATDAANQAAEALWG